MEANNYQRLAQRTIAPKLWENTGNMELHALHGMAGELGEIHSLYQKVYQGHQLDKAHLRRELGDLLWFAAELSTAHGWLLSDVMHENIDKLKARYPEGFETEKSLNRAEGDI